MTALPVSALARPGHDIGWVTAAPLWSGLLGGRSPDAQQLESMRRPALLRLDSDDFMTDLTARLGADPASVAELVAQPKTYRPGPPGASTARTVDHVKLFQPVHGHFNLVAATLVCRIPGLPDRSVDPGSDDEVGFVLRRVSGPAEAAWTAQGWITLADPEQLAPGEELLPMFPVTYQLRSSQAQSSQAQDRARRLFVGLIPTASAGSAKVGASQGGGQAAIGSGSGTPADHRPDELDTKVIGPLTQVTGAGGATADRAAFLTLSQDQRREVSRFILLDFADLLARYAPALWAAMATRQVPVGGVQRTAYELMRDSYADTQTGLSWLDATLAVWAEREAIWGETASPAQTDVDLSRSDMAPAGLRTAITLAWPSTPPPLVADYAAPKLDPRAATRYVIRCIYRRPCCGALCPDVVSAPSSQFAIAAFFDVDAPARPVQIAMPIDTSIAGLRKSPRNVSVMVSRELRQQMERVMDAKKLVKGEMSAAGSVDFGLICSFSLPIITLCALILLLVFVFLLNIIFWWVPFFRICFPLPLKASDAKGSG